jgi:aminoglycoside phosphotransferase (APT) family kinase protein
VGEPGDGYPWPFFGAELVRGQELAQTGLTDAERAALGRPLGAFLRALHDAEVDVELPLDPIRRTDMPYRAEWARTRFDELGWTPPGAARILDEAAELPPAELTSLVHGDLHLRHAVVDEGRLAGVIDWGDVCRSDPAVDLVLLWAALPPDVRPEFFAEYGAVDEAALLRSRVLSLFLCSILAIHARAVGDGTVEWECLAALDRTVTG